MAYRSDSKRLSRLSLIAPLSAALLAPLFAGCQSNAQQDLVAREMRMQEDQIYALEDYLAEYQQLLCKVRAENAAMRQQLANGDLDTTRPLRPSPRARNGEAPTLEVPAIEAPPPKIELPEVPPLEETTSADANADGEAALAAGQPADGNTATQAVALEAESQQPVIHDVWLHGEVVENDSGSGPRLVVEVEPRDADGQPTEFDGILSLMLLAADPAGGKESLARWDYDPAEVRSAKNPTSKSEPAFRFHLELAADTPLNDPTEIWLRMISRGGKKILAHAAIDLHEPGYFSSFQHTPPPRQPDKRRSVMAAVQDQSANAIASTNSFNDTGWTTARPGEIVTAMQQATESKAEWRASSEPLPVVVTRPAPARSKRRTAPPTSQEPAAKLSTMAKRQPSSWLPDRPLETPRTATTSSRPRWSATR